MLRVKIFTAALIFFCATGLPYAESRAEPAPQNGYAVLLKSDADPYWRAMAQGFKEAADSMGLRYDLQMAEGDSPALQLAQCQSAIARNPQALLLATIDTASLMPCLIEARRAGIKIVDLDISLDSKIAAASGVEAAFSVGSDDQRTGEQAAEFLANHFGIDAAGRVLIIEGKSSDIDSNKRVYGFRQKLKLLAPNLSIAASEPGNWDSAAAAAIANRAFVRHADVIAVFAANDIMAIAAGQAARAKDKNPIIIGIDGSKEALIEIRQAHIDATVAQLPYLMARQAFETLEELSRGQPIERVIFTPSFVITKDVLNKRDNHMLRYVK